MVLALNLWHKRAVCLNKGVRRLRSRRARKNTYLFDLGKRRRGFPIPCPSSAQRLDEPRNCATNMRVRCDERFASVSDACHRRLGHYVQGGPCRNRSRRTLKGSSTQKPHSVEPGKGSSRMGLCLRSIARKPRYLLSSSSPLQPKRMMDATTDPAMTSSVRMPA